MPIIKNNYMSNYTQVHNSIIRDTRLSSNAFRLLLLLRSLPDNYKVWQNKLAEDLDMNDRTLRRCITNLKELGYLEIEGDNNYDLTYIILDVSETLGQESPKDSDNIRTKLTSTLGQNNQTLGQNQPQHQDTGVLHNNKYFNKTNNNNTYNKKNTKKDFENEFEILLEILKKNYQVKSYSSRFNKSACKTILEKKINEYGFEKIKLGYENYIIDSKLNKTEFKYLKMLSTFLNQNVFLDFLQTNPTKPTRIIESDGEDIAWND